MSLNLPLCTLLTEVAEARATAMGVAMVIALADEHGELITFARMAEALPASTEIAVAKAYTAAALRMPTEQVGVLAQPGEALYGIQDSMQRRIVTFGGGRPLYLAEKVIGAIGISGGNLAEDLTLVDAVVTAFKAMKALRGAAATVVCPGMAWTTAAGRRLGRILRDQLPQLGEEAIRALTGAILLV